MLVKAHLETRQRFCRNVLKSSRSICSAGSCTPCGVVRCFGVNGGGGVQPTGAQGTHGPQADWKCSKMCSSMSSGSCCIGACAVLRDAARSKRSRSHSRRSNSFSSMSGGSQVSSSTSIAEAGAKPLLIVSSQLLREEVWSLAGFYCSHCWAAACCVLWAGLLSTGSARGRRRGRARACRCGQRLRSRRSRARRAR